MRRADRLFQIVQILRGGRLTTAADLAETLEVSKRTIYRDIADLMANRVPIEGEAGVGYVMRDGFDLPPLMFTQEEVIALVAGARLIKAWGGASMALGAVNALDKIEAILPQDALSRARSVHVHAVNTWGMGDGVREAIDLLESYVDQSQRVSFSYRDKNDAATTRTVRALSVWFWGQVWTFMTWCELREDFRMFRVDRMSDIAAVGRFVPEDGKRITDFLHSEIGQDHLPYS